MVLPVNLQVNLMVCEAAVLIVVTVQEAKG